MMHPELQERLQFPMERSAFAPPKEYATMRAKAPIVKVTMPDGSWAWMATRYEDVRTILADNRFTTEPSTPNYPMVAPARAELLKSEHPKTLIRMDPPEHTKHRRMLTREFMLTHIDAMRPYIQTTVDELLDEIVKKGPPFDLVEDFALALPTLVMCKLLGVPYGDRDFFQERSQQKLDMKADPEVPARATREMRDYLRELVRERADSGVVGDDVISRLVANFVTPGDITWEEAIATVELLLMGGHETTANMIALGTVSLMVNPEQRDALVADPSLVKNAVEEMLRFHTIVHYNGPRVALDDIQVGDTLIRKGEGVLALIAAANRDPDAFPEPDTFDIRRKALHHVAFSYGVHQCIGQPLARAELRIVFSSLFRRLPTLRLAVPFEELDFKFDSFVYGIGKLPVTW
jgi:cytochrome P450